MFIVVLTGGIGSGKSTVSDLFEKKGIDIVDADVIARQITTPGSNAYQHILTRYGPDICTNNKNIDRARLRQIVFNQPHEKTWLEELTHPLIRQEIKHQIQQTSSPYCIAVIPLFTESGHYHYVHRVCVIDVCTEQQARRARERDQDQPDLIKKIMSTQAHQQQRLALADDIIDNNGDFEALHDQVERLHTLYIQLAKEHSCP